MQNVYGMRAICLHKHKQPTNCGCNKTGAHASKIPCGQPDHIHISAEYDSINEHNASMYVRLKTDSSPTEIKLRTWL